MGTLLKRLRDAIFGQHGKRKKVDIVGINKVEPIGNNHNASTGSHRIGGDKYTKSTSNRSSRFKRQRNVEMRRKEAGRYSNILRAASGGHGRRVGAVAKPF